MHVSITCTPLLILEIASVLSVSSNHHQHYDLRRSGSYLSLLARRLKFIAKSKQTVVIT